MKLFERDGKFSKESVFLSVGFFSLFPVYLLTNLFQGVHVTAWGMMDWTVKAMTTGDFALAFTTLTGFYVVNNNAKIGT